MPRSPSWTDFALPAVLGGAACAACCAVPLVGVVVGTGAASVLAAWFEPLAAVLLAAAALAGAAAWWQRRARTATTHASSCSTDESCGCETVIDAPTARAVGCTLDERDMPTRTEAFRTLFATALKRRVSAPGQVEWTLAWSPQVESDARALAAAESGCCSFFSFDLERSGTELRWTARTPPDREDALRLLDRIAAEAHPRA